MKRGLILMVTVIFCQTVSAGLIQVNQSDFGTGVLHENFGETVDYSNAMEDPYENKEGSIAVIGTHTNYVFTQTGVTLTSPIPNIFIENTQLPCISVIQKNQNFVFETYGEFQANITVIPGGIGAKFLLEAGASSSHFAPFVLTFPDEGATKIGGNWIMSGQTPGLDQIVITSYDKTGNLLGEIRANACNVSDWANNFVGFESSDGTPIKSIGIDYSDTIAAAYPALANLVFEPAPEPCSVALVLCGFSFFLYRFPKR